MHQFRTCKSGSLVISWFFFNQSSAVHSQRQNWSQISKTLPQQGYMQAIFPDPVSLICWGVLFLITRFLHALTVVATTILHVMGTAGGATTQATMGRLTTTQGVLEPRTTLPSSMILVAMATGVQGMGLRPLGAGHITLRLLRPRTLPTTTSKAAVSLSVMMMMLMMLMVWHVQYYYSMDIVVV